MSEEEVYVKTGQRLGDGPIWIKEGDTFMRKPVIHYDHNRRQCFIENDGDQSIPVDLDVVKNLWESMFLEDYNLALFTLANHEWDMEAVEKYYKASE